MSRCCSAVSPHVLSHVKEVLVSFRLGVGPAFRAFKYSDADLYFVRRLLCVKLSRLIDVSMSGETAADLRECECSC